MVNAASTPRGQEFPLWKTFHPVIDARMDHNVLEPRTTIAPNLVSIIVPVKDNQKGINRLLYELEAICNAGDYPKEAIIVDNNSSTPIKLERNYAFSVKLLHCTKPGPAAARNAGAHVASGAWLLFTDSDCVPAATFLSGYSTFENNCIALMGGVDVVGADPISKYYRQQNILCPPFTDARGYIEPWTLVTANCLILKKAFELVRGFDESYTLAGGEDTDIGLRLRRIGRLGYQPKSKSSHHFEDGFEGLIKRFIRYGLGNRLLSEQYRISMKPDAIVPNENSIINYFLASVHHRAFEHGLNGSTWESFDIQPLIEELAMPEATKYIAHLVSTLKTKAL